MEWQWIKDGGPEQLVLELQVWQAGQSMAGRRMFTYLAFCGIHDAVAVCVRDIELPVPLLLLLRGEAAAVQRAARAVGPKDSRPIHAVPPVTLPIRPDRALAQVLEEVSALVGDTSDSNAPSCDSC